MLETKKVTTIYNKKLIQVKDKSKGNWQQQMT